MFIRKLKPGERAPETSDRIYIDRMWLRANANRPEDSYSPRSLKLLALTLSLLAVATLAIATNLFKGA